MRICSPHVGLFPSSNSGGVVYERELLKHMAWQGAELDIILPKGQPYELGIENWHIHNAPFGRGYRWYVSNIIFPPLIKKVYNQTRFEILRAHSLRFVGPAALWAKKRYRLPVPVVAHHHHIDVHWLNEIIDKRVVEACHLITTDSVFSKRQLQTIYKINGNRVQVVYAGVDARFKPESVSQHLINKWNLADKKIILTLGGLKARKNIKTLLEIFQHIVRFLGETVILVIAGSGPELTKLEMQATSLGINQQVRFTGFVAEADKVAFYNMADVYVSASSMEGFGMTPAEAMACGKPAVVSKAGSLPEVVEDGKTGFVVSTQEPELFAEKIITLLNDNSLAQQFGQAGLAHVKQNFRWDIVAQKTLTCYQELLEDFEGIGK